MTVSVEFLLSSPSLPLVSFPEALQTGTIECVHGLCIQRDVRRFMIRIDPVNEMSEDELRALDEVLEATRLGRANDQIVYQLTVGLEETVSEAFAPERFDAAQIEPTTITPEGWHEKRVFKNYETLREFQTRCEEYDISIELVSISPNSDGSDEPADYGLTDRQHEALTLAISRGYYESPRKPRPENLPRRWASLSLDCRTTCAEGAPAPLVCTRLARAPKRAFQIAKSSWKYVPWILVGRPGSRATGLGHHT